MGGGQAHEHPSAQRVRNRHAPSFERGLDRLGQQISVQSFSFQQYRQIEVVLQAAVGHAQQCDGVELFRDTRLGCWAHARRRFVDASKVLPAGKRGRAHEALDLIGKLYAIEKDARELNDTDRLAQRQSRSRPVIDELRRWLDQVLTTVPPSTVLGGALGYLHRQWPRLIGYLQRGDLPIDNNPAENAIRPFVVGRKAWLFSDTPAGARASALIYSLVETAKANGIEPYLWLRQVLRALPTASTVEHFEALLPWNLNAENLITA